MEIDGGTDPVPAGRRPGAEPVPDRVYYRSADIAVSGQWFVTARRAFALSQLREVRTARSGYHPATVGAVAIAMVIWVAVAVSLPSLRPAAWPFMLGVAVIPAGVAAATWRLRPRAFELWAEYRGEVVLLYRCTDEKTFGHVCRALIRARERRPGDANEQPRYLPAA